MPFILNIEPRREQMTDEVLNKMERLHANMTLNAAEKRRWVELHNRCANLYFIKKGQIEEVPPCGWWY